MGLPRGRLRANFHLYFDLRAGRGIVPPDFSGRAERVIEQAMIFALGFLFAGLAALALAPAFWQRAIRLTRRQLEMQIPLSVQEILAERDQLRAEFAVERCRLDQRAEDLGRRHADQLASMGRQATKITALETEIKARARSVDEADQARLEALSELATMEAEIGAMRKALYDTEGLLGRKQDEFLEYIRLQESMKLLGEMRFAALAASDARVAGLELRLGDFSRNLTEAEQKLMQKELQNRSLNDVLTVVRHEREVAENQLAQFQEKFEREVARAAQVDAELAALREQHDGNLSQLRTLMVKMNVNDAALDDARRREKEILAQRDVAAERSREAERTLNDQIAYLRSEQAAAQGALQAARARCEELDALLAAERTAGADRHVNGAGAADSAALRQSISEVGATVLRLMRPNGQDAAPAAEEAPVWSPATSVPALLAPEPAANGAAHEPSQPADHAPAAS